MTVTYEQNRHDVYDLIPGFGFTGTTSAAGTVATLVDAIRLKSTLDIGNETSGAYVFTPDDATASDRWRRIDSIAEATGTITPEVDWSDAPGSAVQYEIMGIMSPDEYFNLVSRLNREHRVIDHVPISPLADSDMDSSGVTNYTATNSTRVKVTTAANVLSGTQALEVTLTAALGYVLTGTRLVVPSREITAFVAAQCTAGDTARAALYDVTNSAEFGTVVTHSEERYMVMEIRGTVPATCRRVALRLGGVTSGDIIFFDSLGGPWQDGDVISAGPSWLDNITKIARIREAQYHYSTASYVYDAFSRTFVDWGEDEWDYFGFRAAANPGTLQLFRTNPMRNLFYEARRPGSDYVTLTNDAAGESVALAFDREYFAFAVANEIFRNYVPEGEDERVEVARKYVYRQWANYSTAEPVRGKSQGNRVSQAFRAL